MSCNYVRQLCYLFYVTYSLACYGVPQYSSANQWLCQRCQAGASHYQDCCLCLLRGGALKPTDGGRWAHLVCAVAIPDVHLGNPSNKEPVVTENITRARRKLVRPEVLETNAAVIIHIIIAMFTVPFNISRSPCTWTGCVCSVHTTKVLYCNARYLCTLSWTALQNSPIRNFWFPLP